jgi:hypothetical protein
VINSSDSDGTTKKCPRVPVTLKMKAEIVKDSDGGMQNCDMKITS